MTQEINLKSVDLLDYQAFVLFYSKKARKQMMINTIGIFGEAMIAGFVIDKLTGYQIFTIIGVAFGIFWVFFYPFFLKNRRLKALKNLRSNEVEKTMKFEVNDEYLAYYKDELRENEKFAFSDISEIYELKNIFVIFLGEKVHIIIPRNDETTKMISLSAKNSNKHILKYENLEYSSVVR
ncbi:hypothetical protein KDD93_02870 [Campylobacter sp. faydin G-24]|uniref:YcxB-like protein domain-containing protein n=1 Tax=Campylobacter anatolicus TaxID=2829105 RepID=A0ABS5HIT0_9BACT|nr:hypothetical protein [Campylobacter anatolicus]MBR8461777.1 hypothetical protein [Campylobacter anatolicus]MBR8463512.1 hypothetical protein [Campylobacter anatolicus]MBR8465133.1 hypothetical protein [Campylobacter anatolicus]